MTEQPVGLDAHADRLVVGSDHPWWNESAWFGFAVPERKINGFFYFWHRPNMKLTAGGVAIWDDVGTTRDDCLYYHWFPFNPMSPDTEMFDFQLENGMSVATREPLRSYQLTYEATGCSVDLLWKGAKPALDVTFGADSHSTGADEFGDFHYEQLGHVTGTLEIEGERIEVDCHHIRDRSRGIRRQGIRRPEQPDLRAGLEMCWVSERTGFSVTCLTSGAPGLEEGASDPLIYGLMVQDGVQSSPVSAERRVTERAADGRPLAVEVDMEDAEGRTIHAKGWMRNCLKYSDLWFVYWCLVEWEVDGEHGWGESQELASEELLRRHQRRALRIGN
jgi:hypothetical protein